jgi:phosphoribosylanthranilate isomerase
MPVEAKICGINSADAMRAAVDGGADFVGLVFYPPSPRAVSMGKAAELARLAPEGIVKVGLFVDMDDAGLRDILSAVPLDLLQLHGAESPDRVRAVGELAGRPVMKAIRVAGADDIAAAPAYFEAADRLLFDAKAPPDMKGALPGGNALVFDWTLLAGREWPLPWMLSGGLDAGNVADAVRISGARAVDVSSGVEIRPGVKDTALIAKFLAAVKAL